MKPMNDPTFPRFSPKYAARRPATLCLLTLLASTGCWKTEFSTPQLEVVDFAPNDVPVEGWVVTRQTVPLECPDGEDASFLFVYPEDQPADEPLPVALVFHSGAFDFVYEAEPQTPLTGLHYATPSRLDSGWAVKAAFSTLGMYPSEQAEEMHDGSLAVGLAERGYGLLLPTNCWGDLWHNMRGQEDNDYSSDFFYRDGRAAAQWAYSVLMTDGFADAIDVVMPFTPDRSRIVWAGLGEGGRAVQELLSHPSLDVMSSPPEAVLLDSTLDDLRAYAADPTSYASQLEGVSRLYTGGAPEVDTASLSVVPTLPDRLAYIYSPSNPIVPLEANLAALDRLGVRETSTTLVQAINTPSHVLTNGYDPALTEEVLNFLVSENASSP